MTNTDHSLNKTKGREICPFQNKLSSHIIPQMCKYSLFDLYRHGISELNKPSVTQKM